VAVARHTPTCPRSAIATITALSLVRNTESRDAQASVAELKQDLTLAANAVESWATTCSGTFKDFEQGLVPLIWAVGRATGALFLACRQERLDVAPFLRRGRRSFRLAPPHARNLNTLFGVVRYWRTYLREVKQGECRGFHPLDMVLGLTEDRFSLPLLSVAVRLSLQLSFAKARSTLGWFVPNPPSTEVVECAVLGLGRHTQEWFESAPVPNGDGEVLVMLADSKGTPTATEEELTKRRGKRRTQRPRCHRHRGRERRHARGSRPRRKKGDKSKNAKMATLCVMYTLRRGADGKLHGPINRWIYASFAPKRHCIAVMAREARKRGFGPRCGKVVQLVTDGDNDLARYATEFFPEAIHTIDIMHLVEKLWSAGESLYPEGSEACQAWVATQKERLYTGRAAELIEELHLRWEQTPKTGPGNKGKRKRLEEIHDHFAKRVSQLNYDQLIEQDLVIGSGAVEGAVKYVIGQRCDHGGMRWIKERVEALLQLRCIEINGDWDRFIEKVHRKLQASAKGTGEGHRLQSKTAAPLPSFGVAA
jgi:hypothetical protein